MKAKLKEKEKSKLPKLPNYVCAILCQPKHCKSVYLREREKKHSYCSDLLTIEAMW